MEKWLWNDSDDSQFRHSITRDVSDMTTCPVAEVLPTSTDEDLDSLTLRYHEKCDCVGKKRMQRLPGKHSSDVRGLD